jgi:hypothetical protein
MRGQRYPEAAIEEIEASRKRFREENREQ